MDQIGYKPVGTTWACNSYVEAPCEAGSMATVKELANRNEYKAAIAMCISLADKTGEENALIFLYGWIRAERHLPLILEHCQACEEKSPAAKCVLGFMYYYGRGVGENRTRAILYYEAAYNRGSATAAYHLGFYYFDGGDSPYRISKDPEVHLYMQQAYERGSVEATHFLGLRHLYGDVGSSIPPSLSLAKMYFFEAFQRGHEESAFYLAESFRRTRSSYYSYSYKNNAAMALAWYAIAAETTESGKIREMAKFALNVYYRSETAAGPVAMEASDPFEIPLSRLN